MITIREELIDHIGDVYEANILCASISYWESAFDAEIIINLQIGGDLDSFFKRLTGNFKSVLDATIWYKDGTWTTYGKDYADDGMFGYWQHHVRPDIPEYLNKEISINI